MTTLTLQIDNPSILAHLKEVLKALNGVKVIDSSSLQTTNTDVSDAPNAATLAAMREAESGNDAGTVCMDSLESFITSMQ